MTIARDLGYEVRGRPTSCAATSTWPTRRSSPAPRPRSCPSARSTTARSASPGPITRAIQETYFATVRGEVDRYKDWLDMSSMPEHDLCRRCRRRSTSTTRRCGTAASRRGCRSPSTTSCGWRPSSTTSAWPTSRAAGRAPTPRTTSSSGGRRPSCKLEHAPRLSPSARPAGPGATADADDTLRHLIKASTSAVCIVAKAWDRHVTEALRTDLDEARGHGRRLRRVPAQRRPAGVLRRRALLRRLPPQPRVQPAGAAARPRRRAPRRSCCATPTAARCPTRSSGSSAEVRRHTSAADRPALPQRRRLRGGQHPRRRAHAAPPRSRAASTATASAPATPTCARPSRTSR